MASARYRRTRGSSSFAASNALTSAGRERPVGAHLRVGHQPRQLVGRRPAPVGPAVADLGQVVLRRPVVGEQRAEPDVHHHRDRRRRPAGSEKIERRGRARRRVGFESRFRARRVCPCNEETDAAPETPEACKFYYAGRLAVKSRADDGDRRDGLATGPRSPESASALTARLAVPIGCRPAQPLARLTVTGLRNGISARSRAPTCSIR